MKDVVQIIELFFNNYKLTFLLAFIDYHLSVYNHYLIFFQLKHNILRYECYLKFSLNTYWNLLMYVSVRTIKILIHIHV